MTHEELVAENAELKKKIQELHRRVQQAESTVEKRHRPEIKTAALYRSLYEHAMKRVQNNPIEGMNHWVQLDHYTIEEVWNRLKEKANEAASL